MLSCPDDTPIIIISFNPFQPSCYPILPCKSNDVQDPDTILNKAPSESKKENRVRKRQQGERFLSFKKKKVPVETTPGPEGLFWCKNCLRSFRKPRQLQQHICIDNAELESFSDALGSSEDDDYNSLVDVDPVPWSRIKCNRHSVEQHKTSISSSKAASAEPGLCSNGKEEFSSKTVPNWRKDPSYISLFKDEADKASFEAHLKSIDYSSVDTLFQTEEKKIRDKRKTNSSLVSRRIFSCLCCKKVSKSISYIRLHCLTHTDFKPFSCPKCSYCTNSKGSLYTHIRKHNGNLFCCSYCSFKSPKRAHLLDHEATHSSIPQICKLCKNSYKTQRSLIAHVKRYHHNPAGKRYAKSLCSKNSNNIQCSLCKKKFKALEILKSHIRVCHNCDLESGKTECMSPSQPQNDVEKLGASLEEGTSKTVNESSSDNQGSNMQGKGTLADIVLDNLLQNNPSDAINFNSVFSDSENALPESSISLSYPSKNVSFDPTSVLKDCQVVIDQSILNQYLQSTGFASKCVGGFSIPSSLPSENTASVIRPNPGSVLEEICNDKVKPAEIKLFEKCRRAPAYVCCVCSAIYICPTALKAHLKEHVNSTSSSAIIDPPDDHFEPTKLPDTDNDLDKVCEILQNSSESCTFDEELEKLYTSSLDMMWYLPEVSVVLQNDPALIDSVLEDISNFPINDVQEDIVAKEESENVLKCFDEL